MTVIQIQNLKYNIGVRQLLNIKHLQVQNGQKIGLVGRNGSGKTTLFRLLTKEIEPDSGTISVEGKTQLLPQLKVTNGTKSGGEVSANYIVKALAAFPKILLADEPTTNLDTSHVEWVENKLKNYQGTLLVISHDRALLDTLCDTIWELDKGEISVFSGNYSSYIEQRENARKEQQKEYEKYKQKEQQLEAAIQLKDEKAERATKKPKNLTGSEARIKGAKPYFAKKQKKLHQGSKALQSRLDQLESVEKPSEEQSIKMTLPNEENLKNKTVIRVEKLSGKIENMVLWRPTTFFINSGDKVGMIGPNGSGKTTLLRMLLEEENQQNFYRSPAMKFGYFDQNINVLDDKKSILENVSNNSKQDETLIRTVLARLGFYREDVHKLVNVLSGGERVKVSLAKIFVSDCNTLILDEPTNYLDIYALEALEKLLIDYEGTILFVSHDRHFVSKIATKILAFNKQNLELFDGEYDTYLNRDQKSERDLSAERLTKIEMNITEVLGRLSNPMLTDEEKQKLDQEFQKLVKERNRLTK